MARFYSKRISTEKEESKYHITVKLPDGEKVEIEVAKKLFVELDDMQREYWRMEKRESDHSRHLETTSVEDLPETAFDKSPEQLLMEQIEATEIHQALLQLPEVQQRRFLLHNLIGMPIKQISLIEGCSQRAVKYTLAAARKKLQEILSE